MLAVVLLGFGSANARAASGGAPDSSEPTPPYHATLEHARLTMDDGIELSMTLAFPSPDGIHRMPGRWPVILTMTAYDKNSAWQGASPHPEYFAERGFVRAIVDVRGIGTSQGQPSRTWSPREQLDTAETIEWLGTQPFSNERVGMFGGSYLGIIQYFAAALAPPHLKAIVPIVAMSDLYREATFNGGMLSFLADAELAFAPPPSAVLPGSLPSPPLGSVSRAPAYKPDGCPVRNSPASPQALALGVLAHPADGPFYRDASPFWWADCIKVPALIVDGWFDGFERGAFEMYEKLSRRPATETQLWVDDTSHYPGSSLSYRPRTADGHTDNPAIEHAVLDFLDRQLRTDQPRSSSDGTHLLVMNSGGRYLHTGSWPPPQAAYQRMYLGAGALTASAPPAGESRYATNPLDGWTNVLSRFSNLATTTPYMPLDQRLEGVDGLIWRTAPLTRAVTIAGPISLHLVASSSAPDTDWIVRVSDIAPDGAGQLLTEGWLRASHRELDRSLTTPERPFHTHTSPTPIEPGRFYDYEIEIWPTANQFNPGHTIQLQLASNDTPNHLPGTLQYDPATSGGLNATPNQPAINTVRYGGGDSSYVLMPLDGGTQDTGRAVSPCVPPRRLIYRLHAPRHARVLAVRVYVNDRRVYSAHGHDLKSVAIKRPVERSFTVEIRASLSTGAQMASRRGYNGCARTRVRLATRRAKKPRTR